MTRQPPVSERFIAPVYICYTTEETKFNFDFADPIALIRSQNKEVEDDIWVPYSYEGIKIVPVSFDYPGVTLIRSIEYSKGKGFGSIEVLIDGQTADSKIDK